MTILDDQRRAAAQPVAPSQPDLELDRTVATDELEALAADRRRTAAGPRLSWASAQPFVRRTRTEEPGEAQVPGWRVLVGGYRRRALLLDLLSALGAGGAVALAADASTTTLTWLAVTAAALLVLVAVFRGYDRRSVGNGPAEFQSLLRAGLGAAAFVALASVALGLTLPRLPIGAFLVLATPTAALGRYVLRRRLHGRRHEGVAMARTLVVGDAASAHRLVTDLRNASHHGYRVVGLCLPSVDATPPQDGVPTLGAYADVPQVAYDENIDVVIVTGGDLAGDALRRLSWALGRVGADLVVEPGLVEVLGPRLQLRPTAGLTLLEVETAPPGGRLIAKSVLDHVLGALLLAAAAPVIAVAALAVRVSSPGPAFYRQTRIGVDGRRFTMWKLRSMYVDADARRAALLAESDRDGLMFKMHDDPRVTKVGRVLRRYSVDELPQLWNVVRGDMSLVGPRPPLPVEVDAYRDQVFRRLRVRPGLTGLWQVSGRADLSWDESVRLDLRYVDNWSVAMDLLILWKTGRAVLGSSGAY
ncbi:sugar transferase [Cellulomonas soli]